MARPRKINSGLPSYCQKDRKTGKLWMYLPDSTRKSGLRRQQFSSLEALLSAWRETWGAGRTETPSLMGQILDGHLAECHLRAESGEIEKSTLADYAVRHAALRPVWADVRIEDVDVPALYKWRDWRGQTAKTSANRERSFLMEAFKYAIRKGVAKENPVAYLKPFREKPREKYVTDAEFMAVFNVAPTMIQAAMMIAAVTGLRQGDILRIRRSDFSDAGLTVKTSKTKKAMVFSWSEGLRRAVILAANSREFIPMHLISTESGKPYTSSGFRSMWHKAYSKAYPKDGTKRAAHQFTFNDLRAKAGSESMDWRILGHLDQKTFERVYNRLPRHVSPSR